MSAVAATPSPVSMTIVMPAERGAELRWARNSAMTATSLQWLSSMAGLVDELMQRALDHRKVGAPRHRHHLPVALDVELKQAALEQRRFVARAGDAPRTHLDARRLVAVIVAVELQAALATDQHPVATLGGPLVEKTDPSPQPVEPTRAAGHQVLRGRALAREFGDLDAF